MVPLDRVLVETDSPYLVPQPLRARRNEPLFVRYVAEKLADIQRLTFDEIAQITTANAVRFASANSGATFRQRKLQVPKP